MIAMTMAISTSVNPRAFISRPPPHAFNTDD